MSEFFNLTAANAAIVVEPVPGQTGVWVYNSNTLVSSAMKMSGVVLDNTQPAPRYLRVYSGGTALNVTLQRGGVQVYSGGLVSGISVTAPISTWFRQINIFAGGRASTITLRYRGTLILSSGAAVSDITISSGGRSSLHGGVASSIVISSGGTLTVSSGGTALAVTSNAEAVVTVAPGGYIEYTNQEV